MAEATRKFANLRTELKSTLEESMKTKTKATSSGKPILRKSLIPHRKAQELKLAFSEFYLSLILLQNYQNLNHTGFRKILKKHDKVNSGFPLLFNKTNSNFVSVSPPSSYSTWTMVPSGEPRTWKPRISSQTRTLTGSSMKRRPWSRRNWSPATDKRR